MTSPAERFERIPLTDITPSKTNPRKHFDEAYLNELAGSIAARGVHTPILVRPAQGKVPFELVAGECRFRASALAKQPNIPAVIRVLSDEQALEVQLEENIHRKDLTPLEEAAGYLALIKSNPDKHKAETIAARIGMSPAYVWDRLKLNDLVAEAKQILEAGKMTVGHAILISRLKPADQERCINVDNEALFQHDDGALDFEERGKKRGEYDDVKPVSLRELESWINDHVRFDVKHAAQAQPLQFESVAAKVEAAAVKPGRGKKVISITFEHFTQPEARDENDRTYGPQSFRLADGSKGHPTCDLSVLGVVAAGDHRGETREVCIARDKCEAHWKAEIAAKKRATNATTAGGTGKRAADARARVAEQERQRREKEQRAEARWKHFGSALAKAVKSAAAEVPVKLPKPLYAAVLKDCNLPAGTTPEQLPKMLLARIIGGQFDRYMYAGSEAHYVEWAKLLGVDVKACEPVDATAAAKSDAKGKKTKKAKAAA